MPGLYASAGALRVAGRKLVRGLTRHDPCGHDDKGQYVSRLTRWLVARLIDGHDRIDDPKVRADYGALEGWVSIVGNMVLCVLKLIVGLSIHSIAVIADAIHTITDTATSVVIIIGFKIAKKPSDSEHPFGHGRMEFIAGLVVAILLFIAGTELLEGSIRAIIHPRVATASLPIILLISGTIVVKELMARFAYVLGTIIDSQAIKADALHHRTDAMTTVLVVVALIAGTFGYGNIDGIMGAFVSVFIFYSAYVITKEAINPLLGEAPSKETVQQIERIASSHEGVLGVHDIICHRYGQTGIVSLHIEVSDKETPLDLHALSEEVEEAIVAQMGGMATVHIDPINKEHPLYNEIVQAIKEIVNEDNRMASFHDLRIVGSQERKFKVIFDIVLTGDSDEREIHNIAQSIQEKLKPQFPKMKAIIKADPMYAYSV